MISDLPPRPQPVFVLSTGRAGSTLVSNILNSHADILSISELWMSLANRGFVHRRMNGEGFWRLLTKPAHAQRHVFRPCGMDEYIYDHDRPEALPVGAVPPIMTIVLPHLTRDPEMVLAKLEAPVRAHPDAPIEDHYHHLFQLLMAEFGKTRWIERSGASVIFAPAILRLFPDAKIIHLTRDGRETALSMARHGAIRMFMRSWVQFRRVGIDMMRPPTLMGESRMLYWLEKLGMWFINQEAAMAQPVSLTLAGRFWSEMVAAGLEGLAGLADDRLLTLRYEDLIANPRTTIKTLTDFVDPALNDADWLAEAARMPRAMPPKWRALPEAEQAELTAACTPGMQALGYATVGDG